MKKEETNQKITELMDKDKLLSDEEIQLFLELIYEYDLRIQNIYRQTPLMFTLLFNQSSYDKELQENKTIN
jgi:hypothetical protein